MGGPCKCLCTVYGSHRVHLFKNQKHYLFLYHQGFFFLLQKLETTKKGLFQLCTLRLTCLCSVSLRAATFSPRKASFSGPCTWGSCIQEVSVGPPPEGRASRNIKTGLFFCTSGFWRGWGGPSRNPTYQQKNRDTPQVWYQVLKTQGIRPLPELLKTRVIQQNNHYCLCCLCVCLFCS